MSGPCLPFAPTVKLQKSSRLLWPAQEGRTEQGQEDANPYGLLHVSSVCFCGSGCSYITADYPGLCWNSNLDGARDYASASWIVLAYAAYALCKGRSSSMWTTVGLALTSCNHYRDPSSLHRLYWSWRASPFLYLVVETARMHLILFATERMGRLCQASSLGKPTIFFRAGYKKEGPGEAKTLLWLRALTLFLRVAYAN